MKTLQERSNLDLLELVCQLHSRTRKYSYSKRVHDTYVEARQEMELRLTELLEAAKRAYDWGDEPAQKFIDKVIKKATQ